MIISHEHKFIFLKTRKTAGTSIEIALSRFCGERDIFTRITSEDEMLRERLSPRGPHNLRVPLTKYTPEDRARLDCLFGARNRKGAPGPYYYYRRHMAAEQVRALIGTTIWNEYYKFCFERNPWDRAISQYFWRTRECEPRPSLLEFLRSQYAIGPPDFGGLSNFGIYSVGGDIAVDRVGLYENLDFELEWIAVLLDLPGEIKLPRAKGTAREDRRHYRDVMGHEESSIVTQVCAEEIARLGYSF
jgi:hypothetical protein